MSKIDYPFTAIPNALIDSLDIDHGTKRLYMYIRRLNIEKPAHPNYKTISKMSQVGEGRIREILDELEIRRLLVVSFKGAYRTGKSNEYTFLNPNNAYYGPLPETPLLHQTVTISAPTASPDSDTTAWPDSTVRQDYKKRKKKNIESIESLREVLLTKPVSFTSDLNVTTLLYPEIEYVILRGKYSVEERSKIDSLIQETGLN